MKEKKEKRHAVNQPFKKKKKHFHFLFRLTLGDLDHPIHTFGIAKNFDNLFTARSHFVSITSSQLWSRKINDRTILFVVMGQAANSY